MLGGLAEYVSEFTPEKFQESSTPKPFKRFEFLPYLKLLSEPLHIKMQTVEAEMAVRLAGIAISDDNQH